MTVKTHECRPCDVEEPSLRCRICGKRWHRPPDVTVLRRPYSRPQERRAG